MVDGWVRRCGSRVDVDALGVFGGCRGFMEPEVSVSAGFLISKYLGVFTVLLH